jgi:hypothetical protein
MDFLQRGSTACEAFMRTSFFQLTVKTRARDCGNWEIGGSVIELVESRS